MVKVLARQPLSELLSSYPQIGKRDALFLLPLRNPTDNGPARYECHLGNVDSPAAGVSTVAVVQSDLVPQAATNAPARAGEAMAELALAAMEELLRMTQVSALRYARCRDSREASRAHDTRCACHHRAGLLFCGADRDCEGYSRQHRGITANQRQSRSASSVRHRKNRYESSARCIRISPCHSGTHSDSMHGRQRK